MTIRGQPWPTSKLVATETAVPPEMMLLARILTFSMSSSKAGNGM